MMKIEFLNKDELARLEQEDKKLFLEEESLKLIEKEKFLENNNNRTFIDIRGEE